MKASSVSMLRLQHAETRSVAWFIATALTLAAAARAGPIYTVVDLNPPGFTFSEARAVAAGQVVGDGTIGSSNHALFWPSGAGSYVDLSLGSGSPAGSSATALDGGMQFGWSEGFQPVAWNGSPQIAADLSPTLLGFRQAGQIFGAGGGHQVGVAYGYGGTSTHAVLWTGSAASAVDLNPAGFIDSQAYGVSGGQQVGTGDTGTGGGFSIYHALLWRGTAASAVDLNPAGFTQSVAHGVDGAQQVGEGDGHALLWKGSAESAVDLNPVGWGSEADAVNHGQQVGWGQKRGVLNDHALLWNGSAESYVDLSTFLPTAFQWESRASGIDADGNVVGFAETADRITHAVMWVPVRLPGDANGDGVVDFKDLLILAQNYGKSPNETFADGDFNGDGSVGFDDLLILSQNYGHVMTAAESQRLAASLREQATTRLGSVPEPATVVLIAIPLCGLSRPRRRVGRYRHSAEMP